MPRLWYDYLDEDEYRRLFEVPRYKAGMEEQRRNVEEEAYQSFRETEALAEERAYEPYRLGGRQDIGTRYARPEAQPLLKQAVEPPVSAPAVLRHLGLTEGRDLSDDERKLIQRYEDIIKDYRAGSIGEEEREFLLKTAPEYVFGNVSRGALAMGPDLRDVRSLGDVAQIAQGFSTSLLPTEITEPIERVPYAGRPLRHAAEYVTSPAGLTFAAKWPVMTAQMETGGVVGGTLGGVTGERGEMIGQTVGALVAPFAPAGARLGLRVARAGTEAAMRQAPTVARGAGRLGRGLLLEEAGGGIGKAEPEVAKFQRAVPSAQEISMPRRPEAAARPAARPVTGEEFEEGLVRGLEGYHGVRGPTREEALASWRAGTGGEPPRGRVPPTAEGAPPTGPRPVPERGYSAIEEILATTEETLLRPGKLTQIPVVKQMLSVPNPSVSVARKIVVSYKSTAGTRAWLQTKWGAARRPLVEELEAAWEESPARFIGPADHPTAVRNTLLDYGQNPELYTNVSPRLRQAADSYKAYQDAVLDEVRSLYGVDIAPYPVKEGGFFVSNVPTRESLEKAAEGVTNSYTSSRLATKTGTARTRLYESAAERMRRKPEFVPETNIRTLSDVHDSALANMAGAETFRTGAGGKTLIEVLDETHAGLRATKEAFVQKMTNLHNRIKTAERQIKARGVSASRLETAARQAERRASPILERIEQLGQEWGPELSYLSGQARELAARTRALRQIATTVGERRTGATLRLKQLQADVRALEPKLDSLRKGYEGASKDPYVFNDKTYRWHTAQESAAIDRILTTRLPQGQNIVDLVDEIRVTAFGGDFSPLSIQGLLGAAADPVTLAFNGKGIVKELATGNKLMQVVREQPELVNRFTIAHGRPLGQMGAEFRQVGRGPERIPGVGKAWAWVNDRSMQAVEYLRLMAWRNDSDLLLKMNPRRSQAWADAEAANTWSKIMPALSTTERGTSVLQTKLERLPVISTSFIGGPITLAKDAASGIAKLGASRELSPIARWQGLAGREQLAVLRVTTMMGTLATISTASYIIEGKSPQEAAKTALDPTRGRFLSIATGGGGYIPIGGPVRSFIRALSPRYVDGKLTPFAATLQWMRGKETPVLGTAMDLRKNKDFLGRTIVTGDFPKNVLSGLWYAAENFMPLTPGSVSEKIRSGEAEPTEFGALAREAGTQLAGVSFYETSPWERRNEARDAAARDIPPKGRNYNELNRAEQRQVDQTPEVAKLIQVATETSLERGSKYAERSTQYNAEKETLAQGLERALEQDASGKRWASERKTVGIKLSQTWDVLTSTLGIEQEYGEPELEQDRLAERYWNLEPDADNDGFITDDEWAAYDSEREAILTDAKAAGVSEDYIKREYGGQMWPNHPRLQAVEEQYQEAKEAARDYFSIPPKIGMPADEQDEVRQIVGQAQAIATAQGISFNMALLRMDIPDADKFRARMYRQLPDNPARERWRREKTERYALYRTFYSDVPIGALQEPEMAMAGAR